MVGYKRPTKQCKYLGRDGLYYNGYILSYDYQDDSIEGCDKFVYQITKEMGMPYKMTQEEFVLQNKNVRKIRREILLSNKLRLTKKFLLNVSGYPTNPITKKYFEKLCKMYNEKK